MSLRQERGLSQTHGIAQNLIKSGRIQEALQLLTSSLHQAYASEGEYGVIVALLGKVYQQLGDSRGQLTCAWYLNDAMLAEQLMPFVPAIDQAQTYVWMASRLGPADPRKKETFARAAQQFDAAGRVAQAAICLEKAEQYFEARSLWARLAQTMTSKTSDDLYAGALARFNLARTSRRIEDHSTANTATVASVHLLEEAADHFERAGQRDRAFDCYQVLAAIGKESETIEHVLEGYVNLVRILREDQLRSYALREFEEAIRYLTEKSELAATATLWADMVSYARREGLTTVAHRALIQQAKMWRLLAATMVKREQSPQLAENALLAAVLAYAELGEFSSVGATYIELAHLPLDPARRAHYARAASRYETSNSKASDPFPEFDPPQTTSKSYEIWHVDLVEWEQKGSPVDVCAEIMVSPESWSEITRRRAFYARLVALPIEASPQSTPPNQWVLLIERLAATELYMTLSPLEALFRRPEPEVRTAVVRELGKYLYKRSFITLTKALSDKEPSVRKQAWTSIRQLHFPHAFDPLARIFRQAAAPEARNAALGALALVDSDEASELVMASLRHAGPSERKEILTLLRNSFGPRLRNDAKKELSTAKGEWAGTLHALLQGQTF